MNIKTCEPQHANAYLLGEMTPLQEQEYVLHLDSCASCRDYLQTTASGDLNWSEVQRFLQPQSGDDSQPVTAANDRSPLPLSVQQVIDSLQPTDHPEAMGRIDNFEIKGVVGSGAMGVVLKARDTTLDRVVALKVMNPALAASRAARSRFEREAKAAATVHHHNVVAIHGVRTAADLPYLAMPYLKGGSLQQRIDDQAPCSLSEILRIGSQIAAGLAAAHQQGVVHRDIKPANIMLDDGVETAVITDFGLARIVDDATMTRTGVISGTPEFMSPEQARGDAIDGKSDIFSLGSLLYMLCTGYPPFRAQTPFGVLRRITDDPPKAIRQLNPEIPEWLCAIVDKLHQKQPESRPTASETQATLEACLAHVYQPDQVELPLAYRHSHSKPLPFLPILLGAITMLAAVTLLAIFAMQQADHNQSIKPADEMPTTIVDVGQDSQDVGNSRQPATYEKEFRLAFADPSTVGELEVEMHRGSIRVTGHDSDEVIVKLSVPNAEPNQTIRSDGLTQLRPRNLDFDIERSGNYIKVDSNTRSLITNVEILVPFHTQLDLDSYQDGKIEVSQVTGEIRARSYVNDITLIDAAGRVDLYSYLGTFTANFVSTDHLSGSSFETRNGSIDLVFPTDLQADVRYRTETGRVLTDFDIATNESGLNVASSADRDLTIKFDEFVTGTINGGGAELLLETTNGDIRLRKVD